MCAFHFEFALNIIPSDCYYWKTQNCSLYRVVNHVDSGGIERHNSVLEQFYFNVILISIMMTNEIILHESWWVQLGRVKRIWYLSPMRAAKVQASLRIRAVSPEPPLLAHTSIESRGTFRQKARSLAPLNGLSCAVKICNDGMLEDTNSLDGAQFICLH